MNIRKIILSLSVAAATIPAAYAGNFVGGELGWNTNHPEATNSQTTREQVQREYEAFRAHPHFFDGTVMVQGDLGYVSGNLGVLVDAVPNQPHTHVMGNVAAPVRPSMAPLTEAEGRAQQQQYINN